MWDLISKVITKAVVKLTGMEVLPATIISREPVIILSFWFDFVKNREKITLSLPTNQPVHYLFQLGYQKETEDEMNALLNHFNDFAGKYKNITFHFLCNTKKEVTLFKKMKMNAVLVSQNCFVDENLFQVKRKLSKKYDAIYLARFTPCKRHYLARNIKKLN